MQYITATQLRTKTKDLFQALEEGRTINLVKAEGGNREQTIGEAWFTIRDKIAVMEKILLPVEDTYFEYARLGLEIFDSDYQKRYLGYFKNITMT